MCMLQLKSPAGHQNLDYCYDLHKEHRNHISHTYNRLKLEKNIF